MDWMLLTEMSSMFCGPWHTAAPSAGSGSGTGIGTGTGPDADAVSAEAEVHADLWITRRAYEFMAARTVCERCGARLGRKVSVTRVLEGGGRVDVGARCRGWRRHRHTAVVSSSHGHDGLVFGALEPS